MPKMINTPIKIWIAMACAVTLLQGCGADSDHSDPLVIQFAFFNDQALGIPATYPPAETLKIRVIDAQTHQLIASSEYQKKGDGSIDQTDFLDGLPWERELLFQFIALGPDEKIVATGGTRPQYLPKYLEDAGPLQTRYVYMSRPYTSTLASAIYSGGEIQPSLFSDGTRRAGHGLAQLPDGRILVIGGAKWVERGQGIGGSQIDTIYDSVLIYDNDEGGGYFDPLTLEGSETQLKLSSPRVFPEITLLKDGGILITGGYYSPDGQSLWALDTVEIILPKDNGSFSIIDAGHLNQPRAMHTATRLSDDRVLIVGGMRSPTDKPLPSAEIFDPLTGNSPQIFALQGPRAEHSATYLGPTHDQVLICGGRGDDNALNTCELFTGYDQNNPTTVVLGNMQTPRKNHQALAFGPDPEAPTHVILMGGESDLNGTQLLSSIEVVDLSLGRVEPSLNASLLAPRTRFEAIPIHGRSTHILIIGGLGEDGHSMGTLEFLQASGEEMPVFGGSVQSIASLQHPRYGEASTMLPNGMVLITGGVEDKGEDFQTLASSECFNAGLPEPLP